MFSIEIKTVYLQAPRRCESVSGNLLFTKLSWDLAEKHWAILLLFFFFFFLPPAVRKCTSCNSILILISAISACSALIKFRPSLVWNAGQKSNGRPLCSGSVGWQVLTWQTSKVWRWNSASHSRGRSWWQHGGRNYHTSPLTSVYGLNIHVCVCVCVCWAQTSLEETERVIIEMLDLFLFMPRFCAGMKDDEKERCNVWKKNKNPETNRH